MPDLFAEAKGWTEVNEDTYKKEVLDSEKPVFLEFWSKKCTKCEDVASTIKSIAKEYENDVKFCHWECPCLYAVKELDVRNLPTVYFYEHGKKVAGFTEKEVKDQPIREQLQKITAQ